MAAAEEDEWGDARKVLDAQEAEAYLNGLLCVLFLPAAACRIRQTPTPKANSAQGAPVLSELGFSAFLDLETRGRIQINIKILLFRVAGMGFGGILLALSLQQLVQRGASCS